MHEYSNVEVISLTNKQFKNEKETIGVLSVKKDSEKSYSKHIEGGKTFFFH
jgi:hypothetical protein